MEKTLGRAAFALALVSALAGQWLAAAPKDESRFDVTILARAATGEPASPAIAALQVSDPDGYVGKPPALKLGEPIVK